MRKSLDGNELADDRKGGQMSACLGHSCRFHRAMRTSKLLGMLIAADGSICA